MERTFIIITPEGVHRGLIGQILKRFEAKGLSVIALKFTVLTDDYVAIHYPNLKSGPVIVSAWKGYNALKIGKQLSGPIEPSESIVGTINGDLANQADFGGIVIGSNSIEFANVHIALWFNNDELPKRNEL